MSEPLDAYTEFMEDVAERLGFKPDRLFIDYGPYQILEALDAQKRQIGESDVKVIAGMRGACFGTIAAIRFSGTADDAQLKKIRDYIRALEHGDDRQALHAEIARLEKGLEAVAERGSARPGGKIGESVQPLIDAFCDGLEEAGRIARGFLRRAPLPTLHRVENGKIMVSRWDNWQLTWVPDDGSYLAELNQARGEKGDG